MDNFFDKPPLRIDPITVKGYEVRLINDGNGTAVLFRSSGSIPLHVALHMRDLPHELQQDSMIRMHMLG